MNRSALILVFLCIIIANTAGAFDLGGFAKGLATDAAKIATESVVNNAIPGGGSYASTNVPNEKELYPYGLVPFQEFVEYRSQGKRPTSRELSGYDRSYQQIATAADKFKKDHEELMQKYNGELKGMQSVSDVLKVRKQYSETPFLSSRDIKQAHRAYWNQYAEYEKNQERIQRDKEREKLYAKQKEERIAREKEIDKQRTEVVIFNVPLHTAKATKMDKAIRNAGARYMQSRSDSRTKMYLSDNVMKGTMNIYTLYTDDGDLAVFSYLGLNTATMQEFSRTLTAKYGRPLTDTDGMYLWKAKNGVNIKFEVTRADMFEPEYALAFSTKYLTQYEREEYVHQQAAQKKEIDKRRSTSNL